MKVKARKFLLFFILSFFFFFNNTNNNKNEEWKLSRWSGLRRCGLTFSPTSISFMFISFSWCFPTSQFFFSFFIFIFFFTFLLLHLISILFLFIYSLFFLSFFSTTLFPFSPRSADALILLIRLGTTPTACTTIPLLIRNVMVDPTWREGDAMAYYKAKARCRDRFLYLPPFIFFFSSSLFYSWMFSCGASIFILNFLHDLLLTMNFLFLFYLFFLFPSSIPALSPSTYMPFIVDKKLISIMNSQQYISRLYFC